MIVLPLAVALNKTALLLCWNAPPDVSQLPPTVVVPVGNVTVPSVIVKLFVVVAKTGDDALENAQLPPEPLKVRL